MIVTIIHNVKILKNPQNTEDPPTTPPMGESEPNCNCNDKPNCPLDGQCQTDHLIYQATVTPENENSENSIGLTARTFKERWDEHKTSFRHERYAQETTLSGYIWKLKKENKNFNISWKIVCRASPFSPVTGQCNLCTIEKWFIIFKPEMASLNSRNELGSHCRHKQSMLLDKT